MTAFDFSGVAGHGFPSLPGLSVVTGNHVIMLGDLTSQRDGRSVSTWELTAHPDTIEVAVHDPSRHAQAHPDLNGGTTVVER
ncbi:hypothetical protein [Streptomyces sp. NPDC059753]|uniref:hypothetical protein n=1 Tax=Streptomyces sp. NPDC059753 TaxID=3346933 RepID=UPI00364B582E